MTRIAVLLIIYCFLLTTPLFSQQGAEFAHKGDSYSRSLLLSPYVFDIRHPEKFDRWFNSRVIAGQDTRNVNDKQRLREEWEEFLGIDVFYPYFKAKEVQKYVQDKTRVDFFKFKGRAEFEEGSSSVRYIFKKRF